MTLIYKINDLESKIPYTQWEALRKEFVEFVKEKKQLEKENKHLYEKEELHLNRIDELTDRVVELETNRDEAIELLSKGVAFCENDSQGAYDVCNNAINREKKAKEILERGKE